MPADLASASPKVSGFDPKRSKLVDHTASADIYSNPDGTRTGRAYNHPVNFKDASGAWKKIDSSLVSDTAGYHNKANAFAVRVAKKTAHNSTATLAKDNWSIGFGLTDAANGKNVKKTATNQAKYSDVAKDTDLEFAVLDAGLEQSIVINAPTTTSRWTVPLELRNVEAFQDGDTVSYRDKDGAVVAVTPSGVAADASGTASTKVRVALVEGPALELQVDPVWVTSADRVYPVRVDPWTVTDYHAGTSDDDAFVTTECSGCNYNSGAQWNGYHYVDKIGRPYFEYYTYHQFDLSFANNQNIYLGHWHGYFYNASGTFYMWKVVNPWSANGVTWDNKPNHNDEVILGASGGGWVDIDFTSWVYGWTHGTPNYGISLDSAGTIGTYYDLAADEQQFEGGTRADPYVEVTYDLPPNTPSNLQPGSGTRVSSLNPTLSATYSDPNGEAGTCLFRVYSGSTAGPLVASFGSSQVGSGGTCSAAVPSGLSYGGSTYVWTVAGKAADGVGGQVGGTAGPVSFSTPTVPSAPTRNGAATVACTQSATVTWAAPTNNGGTGITGYRVRALNPDGSYAGITNNVGASTFSTTVSGLGRGATFKFGIAAQNAAGFGTEAITPTVVIVTTPSAALNVNATPNPNGTSATVTWTAPSSNGGSALTGYTIRAYLASTGAYAGQSTTALANATSAVVTGLNTGTAYRFGVAATNCAGTGPEGLSPNVTTIAPPSAPQNATAVADVGTVTASWAAPASDGGAPIQSYVIELWNGNGTPTSSTNTACATCSSTSFNGLAPGASYYAVIRATNTAGSSPSAQTNMVTTPSAPAAPTGVSAVNDSTPGTAIVSWTTPSSNGAPIQSYTIRALNPDGSYAGITTTINCSNPCSSAPISGLLPSRQYRFGVAATNAVGTGPEGTSPTPITTPSALTAVKAGQLLGSTSGFAGEAVTYTIRLTNTYPTAQAPGTIGDNNADVVDTLPANLVADGLRLSTPTTSPTTCLTTVPSNVGSAFTCVLNAVQANGTRQLQLFNVPAFTGTVDVASYSAVLSGGGGRDCDAATNTVSGTDSGGGPFTASAPLTFCDTGLGRESWYSAVTRELGSGGTAYLNPANGNVVVQQTDSEPIQAHGRLAYALRRTYNSQDTTLATLPGTFGAGWMLNIGQTDDLAADGVGATSLYVPPLSEATAGLAVTLIDRDGTRHTFKPKGLAAVAAAGTTGSTAPAVALLPATGTVCIDQTYQSPPGVHLGLWRYIQVTGTCSAQANPSVLGFAAIRPDGLRYDFNARGQLVEMTDRAGVKFRYLYEQIAGITGGPQLTAVFEASSCFLAGGATPTTLVTLPSSCRAFRVAYTSAQETRITDPAGRVTRYLFDSPQTGPKHLTSVVNPDNTTITYTYGGSGCAGNLLCSASDPRGNVTRFTYTTPAIGSPRLDTVTDRNNNVTTAKFGSNWGQFDEAGHRQLFTSIDAAGRSGTVEEGTPPPSGDNAVGVAYRRTILEWDNPGATCRKPDDAVDNNLCRQTRKSLNDAQTGQSNGITTPDEVTTTRYNSEGQPQIQSIETAPGAALTTTYGYATQEALATGSVVTTSDTVAGSGSVTTGTRSPARDAVLYALSDRTEALSPRGNVAASPTPFKTTYVVANSVTAAPNTLVANVCAGANANTGAVCRVNGPTFDNQDQQATSTAYTYDSFGQRATMTSPKAIAEGGPIDPNCPLVGSVRPDCTTYTYYADADTDSTGRISTGGWLKAVTDPTGKFVIFTYDDGGHQTRTWDRNATAGHSPSESWAASSAPSNVYSEKLYQRTLTRPDGTTYTGAWRYVTSDRDALRDPDHPAGNVTSYTLDNNGNRLTTTSPRGNATVNEYDAEDNLTTRRLPAESAAQKYVYGYDAFNNQTSVTDPNGHKSTTTFDPANRPTQRRWSRTNVAAQATDKCELAAGNDPDFPSRYVCSTTATYDGVDNVVAASDGEDQVARYTFDGAHREISRLLPRYDGTLTTLRTDTVYDADGNPTDICPPREFTELDGAGSCTSTAPYSKHLAYTAVGAVKSEISYRTSGQPALPATVVVHDADGNVVTATDPNLHATSATYDLQRRRQTMTTPRDTNVTNVTTWTYDDTGNVTSVTKPGSPTSRVTAYSYDTKNRLFDTVVGADSTIAGSAGVATGTANIRTRQYYDQDDNVVARLEPRAFTAAGSIATPDARYMVRTDYDTDGRPAAQWVPRWDNQAATELGLSAVQAQQCTASPTPQSAPGVPGYPANVGVCVTRASYDAAGNRTRLQLPTTTTTNDNYVAFGYTDDNLLATVSAPSPVNGAHSPTAPYTSRMFYDGAGREIRRTDALNHNHATSYNADGTIKTTDDEGYTSGGTTVTHLTAFRYDGNGNRTQVTEPTGAVNTNTYTADNLVATSANGGGDTTKYTYDNVGNVRWVSAPNATAANDQLNRTENQYFDDNLLRFTFQPVTLSPVPQDQTQTRLRRTTYSYDGGGRKLSQNTALVDGTPAHTLVPGSDAGTQTFAYSPADRPTTETARNNGGTITKTYDPAGNLLTANDSTSGGSTVTNSYYLDGQLRTSISGTRTEQYTYDGSGNLVARGDKLTSANTAAKKTTYTRNAAGLPTSMNTDLVGVQSWTWSFDEAGRPMTETSSVPGTTTTYTYNPDNTLATQTLRKAPAPAAALAKWSYGYDNNGRVTTHNLEEAVAATTPALTGSFTYHYNNAGRVDTFTDINSGAARTRTLAWDANGNRLGYGANAEACRTNTTVANTQCATFNADNSQKTTTDAAATPPTNTSTYDSVGRLTNDSCTTYTYDGFDRTTGTTLTTNTGCGRTTATTVAFAYDGLDRQRRHAETIAAVTTTTNVQYDGLTSQVLSDLSDAKKAVEAIYVLDPGGIPKAVDVGTSATNEYLNNDGIGNVSTVTNALGTPKCQARFDPFGTPEGTVAGDPEGVCHSGGALRNETFFKTSRRDGTTGQYQMGSRTYDPARAGFLTPDAYRNAATGQDLSVGVDPLTLNRYAGLNGDPVNLVDPDGHAGCSTLTIGWLKNKCKSVKRTVTGAYNKVANSSIGGARVQDWAYTFSDQLAIARDAARATTKLASSVSSVATNPTKIWRGAKAEGGRRVDEYIAATGQIPKGLDLANVAVNPAYRMLDKCTGGVTKASASGCAMATVDTVGTALALAAPVNLALQAAREAAVAAETATAVSAAEAEEGIGSAARACSVNSFTGDTPVLLADGREEPISKVKVGDLVLATDPETGQTESRPVTDVIVHGGKHTMVDIGLADGSKLTATDHHPFWDATTGRFTYAIDLHPGEQVLEADGHLLTITDVHAYDRNLTAYNLTVDDIHTYYAGTTPVLVHNSCADGPESLYRFGSGPQSVERLAADAEAAAANGFPYGVSTSSRLPARFAASGQFGAASPSAIEEAGLGVMKTGNSPFHYTVTFPRAVDEGVADIFNALFYGGAP